MKPITESAAKCRAMALGGKLELSMGLDNRVKTGDTGGHAPNAEDEIDEYREEVEKIIKNAKRRQVEEDKTLSAIINFVLEQA